MKTPAVTACDPFHNGHTFFADLYLGFAALLCYITLGKGFFLCCGVSTVAGSRGRGIALFFYGASTEWSIPSSGLI